jgi:hypothetical protein
MADAELQQRAQHVAARAEEFYAQVGDGRGVFNELQLRITTAQLIAELAAVVRELAGP